MSKNRRLNGLGDFTFGRGLADFVKRDDQIVQNVQTRIKEFQNDYFLNLRRGIDWRTLLSTKNADEDITEAVREVTAQTDGVARVLDTGVAKVTDRNATIFIEFITVYNTTLKFDVGVQFTVRIDASVYADEENIDMAITKAEFLKLLSTTSVGDHGDVDLTGLSDGQIMKYNSATGKFLPADESGGGGGISLSQTQVTLANGASQTLSATAIVSVLKLTAGASSDIFFDGVEADYTQEDATNGTDFVGTVVKVHDAGLPISGSDPFSGSPAQLAGYAFDGDVTDVGGTYNGVATNITFQPSDYGQEAIFNGSSSKIDVAGLAMSTSRFTYSMYLTADTVTSANKFIIDFNTGRAIFSNGVTSPASPNLAYFDSTTWRVFNYALTPGVRTHVLVNVIGGTSNTVELYINGTLQDTLPIGGVIPSGGCVIGNTISGSAYFQGKIDEFRIFDGNVNATQASSLSNNSNVDFTTTQPYHVFKTAGLDLSSSTEINSYSETSTEPTNTTIKRLVSFDNGTSWVYWNGSAFVSAAGGLADLQTVGNTLAELQTAFTNYTLTTEQSVTVAYDLATIDNSVSPSIDFATTGFNVDGVGGFTSLVPNTDYTVSQLQTTGVTNIDVTNISGNQETFLINYV